MLDYSDATFLKLEQKKILTFTAEDEEFSPQNVDF